MRRWIVAAAVAATVVPASVSSADPVTGRYGGLSWTSEPFVVGVTSTATAVAGGDPRYVAPMPQYSGVVSLIMNFSAGSFLCSGSLLSDRRSILTAAHCVHEDASTGPLLSTTAYFYGGPNSDTILHTSPDSTAVIVSDVYEHPDYTGNVMDHNDIAVLRLNAEAPVFAASYGLSTDSDLTGDFVNVAGYGGRSTVGGAVGVNAGVGRLRQGDNRYEYRMGDAVFGGGWETIFGQPTSELGYLYLSDFDSGLAANDTSCLVAADPFFGLSGPMFCNLGVGADEVATAGGDSGGPAFDAAGNLTSFATRGLTFGSDYGDIDNSLNSSFGEFNLFVPVFIHLGFIESSMLPAPPVPEPGSLLLVALGGVGLIVRRRRKSNRSPH